MNNEIMRSVIAKRLSPEEQAKVNAYVEDLQMESADPERRYRPSHLGNIAGEYFEEPDWMVSEAEEERALADMPMEMGMAGMGTINKVSSMLTPEAQALRNMISKRNAIDKVDEPVGKLIQVEGGGLDDIRSAQKDFDSLLGEKMRSKDKVERGDFSRFGFDDYLRTQTDLPVDRWNNQIDLANSYPTQFAQYKKFMKEHAKEGLIPSDSWSGKYGVPEAGKEGARIESKNRRQLDKIYQSAKEALDSGDIQSYDIYRSVVDDLVNKTKPRDRFKYRLPEMSEEVGAEIIPFRGSRGK